MTGDDGDRGLTGNAAVVALAVALVGAAAVAGLTLAAPSAPSGDAILEDVEDRYENAETVVGAATVTVENETETETLDVSFAATDDNESRVAVTTSNGTYVVGSNGTVAWVHDEQTGLTRVYDEDDAEAAREEWAEKSDDGNHSLNATERQRLWDWSAENRTAERVDTTTLDGTEVYVVEVTPADDTEGTVTLWVDTDDATVHKTELAGPNGTVTTRVTETQFNVSVADSTFQPPGTAAASASFGEPVDSFATLQSSTEATLPRVDDDRFAFAEGTTVTYDNATVAVQRYDGPGNLTVVSSTSDRALGAVAENATQTTLAGTTVNVTETDRGVAVWWQVGETRHGVLADLDRETVTSVAEALIESRETAAVVTAD
ncbi:outer membrane lipoprotein carrier protein LolA [Halobaculum sp. MBLA0147]|uniref:LolA family protein n=1 Tax=Halobaculum sp. MBLA0147 TaxID=3079934 RepID=UPI003525528D